MKSTIISLNLEDYIFSMISEIYNMEDDGGEFDSFMNYFIIKNSLNIEALVKI